MLCFTAMEEEENYELVRKLTKQEQAHEKIANAEAISDAMNSEDVDTMWERVRGVMRALVKTDTVVIKPPHTTMDPEKYELEQTLKKAMAKNAMATAMAKVNIAAEPSQAEIENTKPGGAN